MPEPQNVDEYLKRFNHNQKVTGFGLDVTCHSPCPFCAAPDWSVWTLLETEEAMQKDTVCRECGRGAKAIMKHTSATTSFEYVQTSGPEQPEWLTPKMRRAEDAS